MQNPTVSKYFKQVIILATILLSAISAIAGLFLYANSPSPESGATLSLSADEKIIPVESRAPIKTAVSLKEQQTYLFTEPVEHIFFHPLLAYPKRAFDGDEQSEGFDDWFVTIGEFNKIIESVYEKGYILIDASLLYEEKNIGGTMEVVRKPLYIPVGKKPLILSLDDINYYEYMRENGTITKLIVDKDGKIATLSKDDQGKDAISYDNEAIPLLDKFIETHPDFSLNGARGIIAITGFQGILGYRTAPGYSNHASEQEAVKPVIEALKREGWTFASHSYFHHDMKTMSLKHFKEDADRWEKEVKSLIGPTNVYIYPFGARVKTSDPRFSYLAGKGFRIFFGVGPQAYENFSDSTVLGLRRHADGVALRTQRSLNLDLYDADEVIDLSTRTMR